MERLGRKAEIVHLRPSVGFLKHSMDFGHTQTYIDEGYRYAREALSKQGRGRTAWSSASATAPAKAPI
jgi:hypothetical protein